MARLLTDAQGFIPAERSRRASVPRYGILLATACLIGTVLQNMSIFEPAAAVEFTKWSIALAVNLYLFFIWAGSSAFPLKPAIDLLILLPVVLWLSLLRDVIISQAAITGWEAVATTQANYFLGFAFASVFFPANFRCYLIWTGVFIASAAFEISRADASLFEKTFAWSGIIPVTAIILYNAWSMDRKAEENFELNRLLKAEKDSSEEMLYSILPEEVASRLRAGQAVADSFSDATVVFIDIAGSSALAKDLSPKQFLRTLNEVFSIADEGTSKFRVEKVKTIGDAYLAVTGARAGGDSVSAVRFAIFVLENVSRLAAKLDLDFNVRIGIHNGPVVGGVIGQQRATYDYWGDTMNIASRLESAAQRGGITVSKQTYYATREEISYLTPRIATLKGVGDMEVYDVAL